MTPSCAGSSKRKRDSVSASDKPCQRPVKRKNSKRGSLERLVEMPLDVLYENGSASRNGSILHLESTARFSSSDDLVAAVESEPHLKAFVPKIYPSSGSTHTRNVRYYHIKAWNRLYNQYRAIPLSDSAARKRWIEEQKQDVERRVEHAKQCDEWRLMQLEARAARAEAEKNERKEWIFQKLISHGYAAEVEVWRKTKRIWWHAVFDQLLAKKNLTDRVWSNAEKDALATAEYLRWQWLEDMHPDKLASRYAKVMDFHERFVKSLPINAIVLPVGDLFISKEMSAAMESVPYHQEFSHMFLEPLFAQLPDINARWQAKTRESLFKMMERHVKDIIPPGLPMEKTLDLAIAVFQCNRCNMRLYPIQAMVHGCASDGEGEITNSTGSAIISFAKHTGELPWNKMKDFTRERRITFDHEASKRAVAFLEKFGYDPKTTTYQELESLDDIWECKACSNPYEGRLMMTWRHTFCHRNCKEPLLEKVDPETAEKVRERMDEKMRSRDSGRYGSGLICKHCRFVDDGKYMRKHFRLQHSNLNPSDEDVVPALDFQGRLPYRYWNFGPTKYF
ncbi:hypothetical protein CC1G_09145 [Coprinopsis cinerea okayama7|uniref:Uncharacterized protein n=1 Tax=Coprinopsis cinerea (strain Okayama-7 / 130 / ATCC MYA-4618 / FGSC 9003) TaxID=240176 RepID=A8P9Q0_COPC7|nr:hypothetical protein CC1G_09145 [Coprinopsis cinerea okayama7\|eukprot:XP_001839811.2 hypothetical protein CC1G_09145 [Coprinopsis cinerea okayama7\